MEHNYTEQYRPLSPWAYFGLNILFSIPVVGFVFLIVYTFSNANINRRNYARSFWCSAILAMILFGVVFAILMATGLMSQVTTSMQQLR